MQAQATVQNRFINSVAQGDCIEIMRQIPANSVDFMSGSSSAFLRRCPLRTVLASFPAYGSSLFEAPCRSR
jgi:hypothetical protein